MNIAAIIAALKTDNRSAALEKLGSHRNARRLCEIMIAGAVKHGGLSFPPGAFADLSRGMYSPFWTLKEISRRSEVAAEGEAAACLALIDALTPKAA